MSFDLIYLSIMLDLQHRRYAVDPNPQNLSWVHEYTDRLLDQLAQEGY